MTNSRSKLAVTKDTGNFNYDACQNWLFLSFAHLKIFLLIYESSLHIKDITLG